MNKYGKVASGLVITGASIIGAERMLFMGMQQNNFRLPASWSGIMPYIGIAPIGLIFIGMILYILGAIFGKKS